jgi:hypothetical protein
MTPEAGCHLSGAAGWGFMTWTACWFELMRVPNFASFDSLGQAVSGRVNAEIKKFALPDSK